MDDPHRYPDSNDDADEKTGVGPDRGSTTATPRWVKVAGLIALVVLLLFVILLLTGGGHGPGRHTSSGGSPGGHASPSSVTEFGGIGGRTPPAGGHTSQWA
jgi:hypothetical protein